MINPFKKQSVVVRLGSKNATPYKQTFKKPDIIRVLEHFDPGFKLKSGGKAKITLCMFHNERTPSLAIYEETNTYFCFSCEAKGDSYNLMEHYLGKGTYSFKELIQYAKDKNLL